MFYVLPLVVNLLTHQHIDKQACLSILKHIHMLPRPHIHINTHLQYREANNAIRHLNDIKGMQAEVARCTELADMIDEGLYNDVLTEMKQDIAVRHSGQDYHTFNKFKVRVHTPKSITTPMPKPIPTPTLTYSPNLSRLGSGIGNPPST